MTWASMSAEERAKALRALIHEGLSSGQMAVRLETTRNAICGFAYRQMIPLNGIGKATGFKAPRLPRKRVRRSRKTKAWKDRTAEEKIAAVRAAYKGEDTVLSQMAKALGAPTSTVIDILKRTGLHQRKRWIVRGPDTRQRVTRVGGGTEAQREACNPIPAPAYERADLTGRLLGDPAPGRSALDQRNGRGL